MTVRFPAPLAPGDRIAVTAPSSGVPAELLPRLDVAVGVLRDRGYDVVLGDCLDGSGVVSAPARERAAELMEMLLDPAVRAVVPPWGGELAVEVLPHLEWDALAGAEPTWLVGYSDVSTLLLPLATRLGWAGLHGHNLLDTPYRSPAPLLHWLDALERPHGEPLVQGPSTSHRLDGHDDWVADPAVRERTLDRPGTWRPLHGDELRASGRLVGGCIETVSILTGTPYGDVPAFASEHAPEGLLLYLEAAEEPAVAIARHLWRIRFAGWFDVATAVLVGRTSAPGAGSFTQLDAVRSALDGLDVPVVLDVDCGHVPPHLSLVNGALADLVVSPDGSSLTQRLG